MPQLTYTFIIIGYLMDISFEQLKSMVVFAQVIDQGSLSAAAKQLNLSRAVVSYHLKKLEAQLEVKLLNRSTRSINLTDAGQAYYQRCRVIAEQASDATLKTCLCASPSYIAEHGRPSSPGELSNHQWVIYKLTSGVMTLTQGNRSFSVTTQGSISTNNAAARTAFVEAGHGLGRIPIYDALPKIKKGTLEFVMTDYDLADINVYGVFPPGTANSKKLRLLLTFLKEYFANQTKTL